MPIQSSTLFFPLSFSHFYLDFGTTLIHLPPSDNLIFLLHFPQHLNHKNFQTFGYLLCLFYPVLLIHYNYVINLSETDSYDLNSLFCLIKVLNGYILNSGLEDVMKFAVISIYEKIFSYLGLYGYKLEFGRGSY